MITNRFCDDIFIQRHPLCIVGIPLGRTVTILRLARDRLLIHSTAPFSDEALAQIRELGEPAWLLDATNFHDTHAAAARRKFPDIPYFVPADFPRLAKLNATPVNETPPEFGEEIELVPLCGIPKLREFALLHKPSKTLVLADLLFNLSGAMPFLPRTMLRLASGIRDRPGNSRFFRRFITDESAFHESLADIATLGFERIIVAHGEPIVDDAKGAFRDALARSFPNFA